MYAIVRQSSIYSFRSSAVSKKIYDSNIIEQQKWLLWIVCDIVTHHSVQCSQLALANLFSATRNRNTKNNTKHNVLNIHIMQMLYIIGMGMASVRNMNIGYFMDSIFMIKMQLNSLTINSFDPSILTFNSDEHWTHARWHELDGEH